MSTRRWLVALAILGLAAVGCGGGDDEESAVPKEDGTEQSAPPGGDVNEDGAAVPVPEGGGVVCSIVARQVPAMEDAGSPEAALAILTAAATEFTGAPGFVEQDAIAFDEATTDCPEVRDRALAALGADSFVAVSEG